MDAELLGARLAATEAAVLKIDERLDAMEKGGDGEDDREALQEARTAVLEEKLTECLDQLKVLQNSTLETEQAVSEAEAVTIMAVEEAKSEVIAAVESEQVIVEPELETSPVEEILPEPESEGGSAEPPKKSNWLENLFALR